MKKKKARNLVRTKFEERYKKMNEQVEWNKTQAIEKYKKDKAFAEAQDEKYYERIRAMNECLELNAMC